MPTTPHTGLPWKKHKLRMCQKEGIGEENKGIIRHRETCPGNGKGGKNLIPGRTEPHGSANRLPIKEEKTKLFTRCARKKKASGERKIRREGKRKRQNP